MRKNKVRRQYEHWHWSILCILLVFMASLLTVNTAYAGWYIREGTVNWPSGSYKVGDKVCIIATKFERRCTNGVFDDYVSSYSVSKYSGTGNINWSSFSSLGGYIYIAEGTVVSKGSYTVKLTAQSSSSSSYWLRDISLVNSPPSTPLVTSIPNIYTNTTYLDLTARAADADGDSVRVEWRYKLNSSSYSTIGTSSFVSSGSSITFRWVPGISLKAGDTLSFQSRTVDYNGGVSAWSSAVSKTISNRVPSKPQSIAAPPTAYNDSRITLTGKAADPDGQKVKLNWQYAVNSTASGAWKNLGSSPLVSSGATATLNTSITPMPSPGDTLYFRCRAQDELGGVSPWSDTVNTTVPNRNPGTPVISSSAPYVAGTAVNLTSKAVDPDSQKVKIFWQYKKLTDTSWSDIGWTSEVNSNTNVTYNFTLPAEAGGSYNFRCKAQDASGSESGWIQTNSTVLSIEVGEFTDMVTGWNKWVLEKIESDGMTSEESEVFIEQNNWYSPGSKVTAKLTIDDFLNISYGRYTIDLNLDSDNNSQVKVADKKVVSIKQINADGTAADIPSNRYTVNYPNANRMRVVLTSPPQGKIEVYFEYKVDKESGITSITMNKLNNLAAVTAFKSGVNKVITKEIDWKINVRDVKIQYN